MPHTHHTHSGQFCSHASNTLSEIITAARAKHFQTFALTEHMPRGNSDLYPEEKEKGLDAKALDELFDAYVKEARRLKGENDRLNAEARGDAGDADADGDGDGEGEGKGKMKVEGMQIIIGFEAEWIRPVESTELVRKVQVKYGLSYFIGSVHHVHGIPIDYDREIYLQARDVAGGTDAGLFADYYDAQYDMLQTLKPPVVGHFDLIRLLSDEKDLNWRTFSDGALWSKIMRNLEFVREYGGLLEINTAAWRKGLEEPYPMSVICEAFLGMGGRFVLSDDSHGVNHLGTNYGRLGGFLRGVGVREVACLVEEGKDGSDGKEGGNVGWGWRMVGVEELGGCEFWAGVEKS